MGLDTVAPQPAPEKGKESVTDAVIADLMKRREGGLKKYGCELESFNGRSALVDLYQELSDALLYLRQHLMEEADRDGEDPAREEMAAMLVNAKNLLALLRRESKTKWLVDDVVKILDRCLMLLCPEKIS